MKIRVKYIKVKNDSLLLHLFQQIPVIISSYHHQILHHSALAWPIDTIV